MNDEGIKRYEITAKEAKHFTETSGLENQYRAIFEEIKNAALNGLYGIRVQFPIYTPDEIKKTIVRKLEDLGYYVETTSISIYIKW